ncbi:hypothetical protein PIB30_024575 [Stylosanthes scabra]|uniref:LOB domain-containing protein n=1 Tax=Stylosanthes scabra TaxID=79078 RepID=A0ABU6TBR5_9FABA|nr:hypothetical protein [Stylosanthes scabra]
MSVRAGGGSRRGINSRKFNGGGGPCGACKFLRRKCSSECIFAPYFDSDHGSSYFASVHKIFGASNVSKLLLKVPPNRRLDAVITLCYEAQSRLRDPVSGCVSQIVALQQQVSTLQNEVNYLQNYFASVEIPQPPSIPLSQGVVTPSMYSIVDLPSVIAVTPATTPMVAAPIDPSLFDPSMVRSSWAMQQQAMMDPRHYMPATSGPLGPIGLGLGVDGVVDLPTVARDLISRHVPPQALGQASGSNAPSLRSM